MHELYRNIRNYQAVFSLNEQKGNVSVNIYILSQLFIHQYARVSNN